MREIKYKNGFWYHVFNRGADKRIIFQDKFDYYRFYSSMIKFNDAKNVRWFDLVNSRKNKKSELDLPGYGLDFSGDFVDIVCFCLNSNHYHLLLKQNVDDGIAKYMHKLDMGYTKYFNIKNNRSGVLFQGPYRAVYVKTMEQLIYLSCYINGNSEIHGFENADSWIWSSYDCYLKNINKEFLVSNVILQNFKSLDDYRKYLTEVIKKAKKTKKELKEILLE